jgi:glycosyltransferase involved in cell wall biosynthesis
MDIPSTVSNTICATGQRLATSKWRTASVRVWLLIDSSTVGGIERHVEILARALINRGVRAEIVLLQDHGPNPWHEQLAKAGLTWRSIDASFAGLVRALRRAWPDLLHTHGYKAGVLGRAAAVLCGVPVVSTFHAGERPTFPLSAYYWLDRWTSLPAKRIVVSAEIGNRLPFRSTFIPNFIAPTPPPQTKRLPASIGFVGRLSKEKGPDLFCALALESTLPVTWHVFGDGPMRSKLELAYSHRVTFHGIATDMEAIWPTLGLLLMPSRFEGFPMVALEAMAHGIPVAASSVGALPSIVTEGVSGWLYEPGKHDAAGTAIARWFEMDPVSGAHMRLECWRTVSGRFSTSTLIPRLLEVYERALAVTPPHPASHAQSKDELAP